MTLKEKAKLFGDMFCGNPAVYGVLSVYRRDDGKEVRSYYPKCKNYYTEVCEIKNKTGGSCAVCKAKKYVEISLETIALHIRGEEQHIYYPLHDNGTIKFGAIDFDYKVGKEAEGYTFDDVKKVSNLLKELGVAHSIARSTTAGFHLYFFLKEFYPANKFRAFIEYLYTRAGFTDENALGIRRLPEIFPKQSHIIDGGIGNGIKPPMIESSFVKERNCWVDDDNKMIADQWTRFTSLELLDGSILDKLIVDKAITIWETSDSSTSSASKRSGGHHGNGNWEPPLSGSIEKLVNGCAAYRKIADKCRKQITPTHEEGFALFHASMHIFDGRDWFTTNVPGWGKNESELRQLEYSVKKNYLPNTCKTMQEKGICIKGTKCFDKKPPFDDTVDGKVRHKVGIPESEWPDPSPLRYALGKGDDFLLKLQDELLELSKDATNPNKHSAVKQIALRAQVFDVSQQEDLKKTIVESGLLKKMELKTLWQSVRQEKIQEFKSQACNRTDVKDCGGVQIKKVRPYGYSVLNANPKQQDLERIICNFDVVIEEERTYVHDDERTEKTTYIGKFKYHGFELPFSIDSDIWASDSDFYKFFTRLAGTGMKMMKIDTDLVRQSAVNFSSNVNRTRYYVTQGWYGDMYLMPSVLVDKTGVRENSIYPVDLKGKANDIASLLDFKLLSTAELHETLMHIKRDLFNAFPRNIIFTGMGHMIGPALVAKLGITFHPFFWIEGDPGVGKSKVNVFLQAFWGKYRSLPHWMGTFVGMSILAHDFKDALLGIDDFKNIGTQGKVAREMIQYMYEAGWRVAATKSGDLRESKNARCFFSASGEMTPSGEASVVARMIIIEQKPSDNELTRDAYKACWSNIDNYRGITPHFIHWFLNQDQKIIEDRLRVYEIELESEAPSASNASRICQNIAYNYLCFSLLINFFVDQGIMTMAEGEATKKEHWEYSRTNRDYIIERCSIESSYQVFVSTLRELVAGHKVSIKGLVGYDVEHCDEIGFSKGGDIFLHPQLTYQAVKKNTESFTYTKYAVARQLKNLGFIEEVNGELTAQVRVDGERHRYWKVPPSQLFIKDRPTLVSAKREEIPMPEDSDGLF